MKQIKNLWESKPLYLVLIVAAVIRLMAVIFSEGYAMHDDHFLIIESSQSWVDGLDYNSWLPGSEDNNGPTGHSFFYIGLHYLLFSFLEILGITSSDTKMYFVRFFHAAFSLLIPYFTYKITLRFGDKKTAGLAGLLLAILWPMPMFSVRNLVEMVCIPPVMAGIYLIVRKDIITYKTVIFAGVIMGLAVGIRIQSLLFIGGLGLALWLNKEFWKGTVYGIAALLGIFLSQITDLFLWGLPFAEFGEYISYNMTHSESYFVEPWFKFIFVVLAIAAPPVSLYFLVGLFYEPFKKMEGKIKWDAKFRQEIYYYLPMMVFFVFHCFYPNKQERFILPFIPFFFIAGMLGWRKIQSEFNVPAWLLKFEKFSWILFLVLNMIVMSIFTFSATKRPRIKSMTYLKEVNADFFLVENSHDSDYIMTPEFYFEKWGRFGIVFPEYSKKSIEKIKLNHDLKDNPDYLVFFESKNLDKRLKKFERISGSKYEFVYEAESSLLDSILYTLNPEFNKNESARIYKRVMD